VVSVRWAVSVVLAMLASGADWVAALPASMTATAANNDLKECFMRNGEK
jgi:hypothetical protein